jgi:O-antigen/teichoic acid export membrane protein
MLRTILGTFSSRVIMAIINFGLVIATARLFGAEGRGIIALFITNLAVTGMICKLVGGTALIYLTSRISVFQIAIPSYIWVVLASIGMNYLFVSTSQIPDGLAKHLLALAIIDNLSIVNKSILGGKEKIKIVNILAVCQSLILILSFGIMLHLFSPENVHTYIISLYFPYLFGFCASFIVVWPYIRHNATFENFTKSFISLIKYSVKAQSANIVQFLNYRLSYYFLNSYLTISSIGIFSIGMTLSESIWLFATSIATIQYIRIANTTDLNYANKISILLAKLSFVFSASALIVLLLIPSFVYVFLFGSDFSDIKAVIAALALGILVVSLSNIFSHYFMGLGKYEVELYATLAGLVVTIIACFALIPALGIIGAAISASLSYLTSFTFLLYRFRKATAFKLAMLIPNKGDILLIKAYIQGLGKNKATANLHK